jgi:hypothetical protein
MNTLLPLNSSYHPSNIPVSHGTRILLGGRARDMVSQKMEDLRTKLMQLGLNNVKLIRDTTNMDKTWVLSRDFPRDHTITLFCALWIVFTDLGSEIIRIVGLGGLTQLFQQAHLYYDYGGDGDNLTSVMITLSVKIRRED